MSDPYTTPQTITKVPAGELGTTLLQPIQQAVNFGVGIYENVNSITTNYCITTGSGAFSAGPITINAVVTVPDGSSWIIR